MKGKERTKLPGLTGFFQITVGIGLFSGILSIYLAFSEYSELFKTEYALLVGAIFGISILELSLSIGMLVLIAFRKRAFLILFWIGVADRAVALLLTLFLNGNVLNSFSSLIISAVWAFYFYYSDNFARAFTPYKKPPLNPDTKPQPVTASQETAQQKQQLVMNKANEQADAVAPEPTLDASKDPIEEAGQAASTLNEQPKADELKQKKIRFCKYCGAQLKKEDVVCPNCGKRIRIKVKIKSRTAFVGLIFLLCVSLGFNVYQLIESNKAAQRTFAQDIEIETLEQTISRKEKEYVDLFDRYLDSLVKVSFLDDKIALVVSDSESTYHTYDCFIFKNCTSYMAYNIEQAEFLGYRPCEICH